MKIKYVDHGPKTDTWGDIYGYSVELKAKLKDVTDNRKWHHIYSNTFTTVELAIKYVYTLSRDNDVKDVVIKTERTWIYQPPYHIPKLRQEVFPHRPTE